MARLSEPGAAMAKLPEPEAAMAKLPEPEARARLAEEATGKLSEPEAGVEKLMAKTAQPTVEGGVAKGGGGRTADSVAKDSNSEGTGGATEPEH